jgi:hypothetical protein
MQNPWVELPDRAPYVLPSDRLAVMLFNAKVPPDGALRLELIPEPFLGRPDAPVVLLNLNPGFDEREIRFHSNDALFIDLSRKNLLHEDMDYPFYLLNPRISASLGHQWWMKKLKEPICHAGLERVARRLLCVEYFPYHSQRYRAARRTLDSQGYSFDLVRQAIGRGALIVIMRGEANWVSAVRELASYGHAYKLNSVQNVAIYAGNCPSGYAEIARALAE